MASTDRTRYTLNGVFLAGNLAVATDGRSLVACIAQREEDDDAREAIIPTKAALAGFKDRKKGVTPMLHVLPKPENDVARCRVMTSLDESTTYREIDGNFPHIDAVVPKPEKHTLRVALNVKLLLRIAKALGEDQVTLHLDPDGFKIDYNGVDGLMQDAMIVTGRNPDAVGILMPCRTPDLIRHNKTFAAIAEAKAARKAAETTTTETTNPTPQ